MNDQREKRAIYWLARLNSPELSETDEQAFVEWLNASPENQCAYIKAERLWHEARPALECNKNVRARRQYFQIFLGLPVIASALAFTLILTITWSVLRSQNTEQLEFTTAYAEQAKHLLEDGSILLLNANTSTQVQMNAQERMVTINQGEAFFAVKRDSARPFRVTTEHGTVSVVGTQFSVLKRENDTLVTVLEGIVDVEGLHLKAGEKIRLSDARAGLPAKKVNASEAIAWRQKRLVYRGDRLSEVIEDLNRYFAEDIQLSSPELGNREIVAVIYLSDFQKTARALAQTLDLSISTNTTTGAMTFQSATD